MSQKAYTVMSAALFWTDENMIPLNRDGYPETLFRERARAEEYAKKLEIKKWKGIFRFEEEEQSGIKYEFPEMDQIVYFNANNKKEIIPIKNKIFWALHYYTLISPDNFEKIEVKLIEKGFSLNTEISDEGILTFIQIYQEISNHIPQFYFIQEVELIDD